MKAVVVDLGENSEMPAVRKEFIDACITEVTVGTLSGDRDGDNGNTYLSISDMGGTQMSVRIRSHDGEYVLGSKDTFAQISQIEVLTYGEAELRNLIRGSRLINSVLSESANVREKY